MRVLFIIIFACILNIHLNAQKTARIGVKVYGYNGNAVDFEFVDDASNNMTFPYKEAQMMDCVVELKAPSLLKINSWVWIVLCPGDDIEADIKYQGSVYEHAEFKGTSSAVLLNSAISDGSLVRLKDRYRLNPLAAVIKKVMPTDYHEATLRNWKKEKELLETVRLQVNPEAYRYIYAEIEGTYLSNLVNYPFMAAAIRHQNLKDIVPDGFWMVLDGYKIKEDKASLRSVSYVNWLMEYAKFESKRQDFISGKEIREITDVESIYKLLSTFYDGALRDTVLYNFLTQWIASGKYGDIVTPLVDDYLKKYNRSKVYRKELRK